MKNRFQTSFHKWDVTRRQAIEIQKELRQKVRITDTCCKVRYVAGVDAGIEDQGRTLRAAAALLKFPELTLAESAVVRMPAAFPYISGLLSFREAPAIIAALERLNRLPDLILCDGQGFAHPRRLGIACHIGVLTDLPAIGVAKTRLIGEHAPLGPEKGSTVPLTDRGERIGMLLRSRSHVKPLFVSPGHKTDFDSAVKYVLQCLTRYRLPETTRWAHRLASSKEKAG